ASVSPAALARAAVSGPRSSDAHSTVWPRPARHCATAAPICPGCSTPITSLLTGQVSRSRPRAPIMWWQAVRPLPGDLAGGVGAVGDRGEPVSFEDAEDVGAAVLRSLAARIRDNERLAARARPEDVLPAGRGRET